MQDVKKVLKKNTMLIALVVLTLFFQWTTKGVLLVPQNITNLIGQNGYVVILAVGMLICILTGGNIDLSVGSVVALIGALAGSLMVTRGMNIYLSMAICLFVGAAIGVWQGFWIAYIRIPAFIVTLSGMMLWRGIALIILGGFTIAPFPDSMTKYFIGSIPEFFGTAQIKAMAFHLVPTEVYNISTLIIGAIVVVIYIAIEIFTLILKTKEVNKTEKTKKMLWVIGRCIIVGLIVAAGTLLLAKNALTIDYPVKNYLITSVLIGVIASAIYIFLQISDRMKKVKKGYETEKIGWTISRCVLICASMMALVLSLSQYKGIQGVLIVLAIVVLVYSYFTSKTVYGRHIYAIGGNEKAAKLSGIDTDKMLFFAYVNMAFLSALAALVCVARFNSAAPSAGTNYELDAIGACYIGGASAYGGIGTVGGVVIGAIFMGILNNGMSIMGIDSNWQKVVKALVLLAAVAFDIISKRRGKTA